MSPGQHRASQFGALSSIHALGKHQVPGGTLNLVVGGVAPREPSPWKYNATGLMTWDQPVSVLGEAGLRDRGHRARTRWGRDRLGISNNVPIKIARLQTGH